MHSEYYTTFFRDSPALSYGTDLPLYMYSLIIPRGTSRGKHSCDIKVVLESAR